MSELALRLSDSELGQKWLLQFGSSNDRALASQILNQLKLVGLREFELSIDQTLMRLQKKLKSRLAVYPIVPPVEGAMTGYDPFGGVFLGSAENSRRRRFGSEDRVGDLIQKIDGRIRHGVSTIECTPTLKQLKAEKLRHIVLVDDISGSGRRIVDFWRLIPKEIRCLLSLKVYELWIVVYAVTSVARRNIAEALPNFPIEDHLISVLPESSAADFFDDDFNNLCLRYGEFMGRARSSLGYRESASTIVFEHGCPNNVPAIFWANTRNWSGLFPNRSIPTELRKFFDKDGHYRAAERLWSARQRKLAVTLLDAVEGSAALKSEDWVLLSLLGLLLKGIAPAKLAAKLVIKKAECEAVLTRGAKMGLYDPVSSLVTPLGKEVVTRFRRRSESRRHQSTVGNDPAIYYPDQCEGRFRDPGKTVGP